MPEEQKKLPPRRIEQTDAEGNVEVFLHLTADDDDFSDALGAVLHPDNSHLLKEFDEEQLPSIRVGNFLLYRGDKGTLYVYKLQK